MTVVASLFQGLSAVQGNNKNQALGLSTNERRPVRFHAQVTEHVHSLKLALQTLGKLVWSEYQWVSDEEHLHFMEMVMDPVITVHDDRVFFEAFSQDMSSYGMVIAQRDLFEPEGEIQCGTTNVDFTRNLWHALEQMRSRRKTRFDVGPTGFGVVTGAEPEHFEQKVELPRDWVRGFLQLQAAMAMPGTRLKARPEDVGSIIRCLRRRKAYSSPRSMRFEFEPGHVAQVVLEPWEEAIELLGSTHGYKHAKTTRVWGRARLALIEPLLPWAETVGIFLKGRALPAFYAVELPGVTFVLGLSGWTGNNWTQAAGFDLLTSENVDPSLVEEALAWLRKHQRGSITAIAMGLMQTEDIASRACAELCRQGRAIFDLQGNEYRHREIFEDAIDLELYFPPEPRKQAAAALVAAGAVVVTNDETRRSKPKGRTYEDRVLDGTVGGHEAHLVLQSNGRIIFGRCDCAFFDENLLNMGPCEHMLALRRYVDTQLDGTLP